MKTPWRIFSSLPLFSSQVGVGDPARPPAAGSLPAPTTLPTLHLPLTASGFSLLRAVQWGLTVVIAGSVTVALWFWWDSRVIDELAAQRERATERAQETNRQFIQQAAQAGMNVSEARATELGHQVAFVNRLTEQRAFSWTRFLSDLEEAVPPHISISSVALDFKETVITLTGAATTHFKENVITLNGTSLTLKDLTTLVNKLENHPAFRNVVLSQHRFLEPGARGESTTPGKDEARTVGFTMTVTYRPQS